MQLAYYLIEEPNENKVKIIIGGDPKLLQFVFKEVVQRSRIDDAPDL